MSNYLVTGAAGMIGARTAGLLLAEGHHVVGLDNMNDAYDIRMKQHRLGALQAQPAFSFVEASVADPTTLRMPALRDHRFDAVFNLAARAGVRSSVEYPWMYVETNITGTLNMLELCREHGISKFVLASTSSLYGAANPCPYTEDQDTSRPLSPYAASKGGAEALAHTYHALHGIDVSVLRYFTVYGPAGRPDMGVFRFVQRIREGFPIIVYGDGTMSRDFTFVDDIARGTIAAARPLGFEVINLGGDQPFQVNELIRTVEQALGRKAIIEHEPAHPADVPATWASIDKAAALLDWAPQISLEDGIARCVAWYEAERSWAHRIEAY
ncbi:MAG: NAD-dependent epimerase/dehydratase family protein [bacterium]|nr:NAD-dependent epimerase/dehydratase family protein [bacterium]